MAGKSSDPDGLFQAFSLFSAKERRPCSVGEAFGMPCTIPGATSLRSGFRQLQKIG